MNYETEVNIRWVEIETEEEEIAWRASLRMLLDLLDEQNRPPKREETP